MASWTWCELFLFREIISRFREIISRFREIVFRFREIISRESEIISRESEIISRESEIICSFTVCYKGRSGSPVVTCWTSAYWTVVSMFRH